MQQPPPENYLGGALYFLVSWTMRLTINIVSMITCFNLLCSSCTIGAAITDITTGLTEGVGQIQKLYFQRTKDAGSVQTIAIADAPLLATWTALETAIDATKFQATDYINNPTNEVGEERTFGGGNATRDGIEITLGTDNSTFEALFYNVAQQTIAEIKALTCEELSVFFINECGDIWGLTDDPATPTTFRGIPIFNLFVGDKKFGGFEEPDSNEIRFRMTPNWSDNLHSITPSDFDALTDF